MGKLINRYITEVTWQPSTNSKFAVAESEVHIWRISISQNLYLLNQLKTLLTPDEITRAGKYLQQKDRHRFIVSRAAQRVILGRYLSIRPAELQFVLGPNKKPQLVGNKGDIIHYNLSHSGDCVLLAVAALPVGTDVEFVDTNFAFQDILPDNFGHDEIAYIDKANTTERFFLLWTRKEALLKATGQGLGEHLPITPSLNGEHALPPALSKYDKNWQLISFNINDGYTASVAAEDAGQSFQFFDADNYLRSL